MGSKSNNPLLEEIIGGDFLPPGGADYQVILSWKGILVQFVHCLQVVGIQDMYSNIVAFTFHAI